jgi:hypothetical protein
MERESTLPHAEAENATEKPELANPLSERHTKPTCVIVDDGLEFFSPRWRTQMPKLPAITQLQRDARAHEQSPSSHDYDSLPPRR